MSSTGQQRVAADPSPEELIAALHVRGHIQRTRASSAAPPRLGPSVIKAQHALHTMGRSHLGDDVPELYARLLDVVVAAEDTLVRLLVSYPDLKPRPA